MEERHAFSETGPKAPDGLGCESDLRDENDRASPAFERLCASLQIDLGLPAPGRAVQQEGAPVSLESSADPTERGRLLRGEGVRRLLAHELSGRLTPDRALAPRPRFRRDERKRARGG